MAGAGDTTRAEHEHFHSSRGGRGPRFAATLLASVTIAAAALLGLRVVPFAAAAASNSGGPQASASASVKKQLKKLKKHVKALQQQVDELSAQPGPQGPQGEQGPQGPQGPAGTAPACQGNNASDKMVKAGSVCIDRYEVSVWSSPTGGTQYGANSDNYPCDDNGQDCDNIYARSVAGVTPSRFITWFQAQQALANSGKRLPTNAEWQQAAAGTPDSTPCNVSSGSVASTGANAGCISNHGANDMVGNLWEWVGDWDEEAGGCASWPAGFGGEVTCLGRADTQASTRFPGALIRGGDFSFGGGSEAGPFAVDGLNQPSDSGDFLGFRGAR